MNIDAAFVEAGYAVLNTADVDERSTFEIDGATLVIARSGAVLYMATPGGVRIYPQQCGHIECAEEAYRATVGAVSEAETEARQRNPLHVDLDTVIMADAITADMFI